MRCWKVLLCGGALTRWSSVGQRFKAARILSRWSGHHRQISQEWSEILKEHVNPNAIVLFCWCWWEQQCFNTAVWNKWRYLFSSLLHIHIVRLKGGDVSYTSLFDVELITVKEYNIPYEIFWCITALSGASAHTPGVPLTARKLATGVRILTLL